MPISRVVLGPGSLIVGLLLLGGCGTSGKKPLVDSGTGVDATATDARDAHADGTLPDASTDTTTAADSALVDAAAVDAGAADVAGVDAGAADGSTTDTSPTDVAVADATGGDAAVVDAPSVDAIVADAPVADAPVADAPASDTPSGDGGVDGSVDATPLADAACLVDAGIDGGCLLALPVFGTGVDPQGVALAGGSVDPHYTLIQSADTTLPGPNAIVVTTIAEGYWLPQAAGSISKWIAPSPDQPYPGPPSPCNTMGTYVYRTTFDLAGFDAASAKISGQWAADNTGVAIRLNGGSLGFSAGSYNAWAPFTIQSGLLPGTNTLDFEINDYGCPNGLRVELSGTASAKN